MRAQDERPAGIDGAAPEAIQTEPEFMDALRALRARSGLSYRDVALRMSRVAPRHAMAKSTLAALFTQDALPRRPGQLTAIVDVLAAELAAPAEPAEPADVSARYLEAWTRLMTARSAQRGTPARPQQAPPPALPPAAAAPPPATPPPAVPPPRHPAPQYSQPAQARSDFEKAGGLWPLLAGAPCSASSLGSRSRTAQCRSG
jgi:hypothetical protein